MGGVLQKGEEGSDKVARGGGGVSSAGVGGWLCRNGGVLSVIDGEGSGRGAFLVGSGGGEGSNGVAGRALQRGVLFQWRGTARGGFSNAGGRSCRRGMATVEKK